MINKLLSCFKKSIGFRVNLIILFIILIGTLTGVLSYISYTIKKNRLYDDILKTSNQIRNRLEVLLATPVMENNFDQMNSILALEIEYPYIEGILFNDLSGVTIAGKVRNTNGEIVDYFSKSVIDNNLFKKSFKVLKARINEENFILGEALIYISNEIIKSELLKSALMDTLKILFTYLVFLFVAIISLKKIILNKLSAQNGMAQRPSDPAYLEKEPGCFGNNFDKTSNLICDYDVDIEKKVYEQLLEHEVVNEVNQQKIDFFVKLAHETKIPLTLICNYLDEYLRRHGSSYELGLVKNNLDKLKNWMVNFLNEEKVEQGRFLYNHSQVVDIVKILREKILLFREMAINKGVKIVEEILNENLFTMIDQCAIDCVVNNLLDNAIKYTESGGEIKVALRSAGYSKIEFCVSDTGIGIPENNQKSIFEPYYRVFSKNKKIEGIGLGLSIVKKIIDQVKGVIEVKSIMNVGTTFTILLEKHNLNDNIVVEKAIKTSIINNLTIPKHLI